MLLQLLIVMFKRVAHADSDQLKVVRNPSAICRFPELAGTSFPAWSFSLSNRAAVQHQCSKMKKVGTNHTEAKAAAASNRHCLALCHSLQFRPWHLPGNLTPAMCCCRDVGIKFQEGVAASCSFVLQLITDSALHALFADHDSVSRDCTPHHEKEHHSQSSEAAQNPVLLLP